LARRIAACKEDFLKRFLVLLFAAALACAGLASQQSSFGLGDSELEASLNALGASAKLDLPGFTAEVSVTWGLPAAQVQYAFSQGLSPAEVWLAAGLASVSNRSITVVVASYKRNKAQGWGALAKELGIKPGSREFKLLKDKAKAAADKAKKRK
jgi:hypothetical protein